MSLFSKKKLSELQAKESSTKKHTILIVDDEESNRKVMASVLRDFYHVLETEDGITALELVKSMENPEQISMVISDQRMPNMTGVELFEQLSSIIPKTVRIIVTGFIDVESIIDSVNKAHIYKFILKPFERVEFLWTAKRAVETFELQKKLDDHLKSLEQRVEERTRELAGKNEELQQAYVKLEQVSLTDQLTELKNRRFLNKYLDADIAQCLRTRQDWNEKHPGELLANANMLFFIIDLDHFKAVNDSYGHAAGDDVLRAIKSLLETVFRSSDYLIRWGGEEFLVVARSANIADAPQMSERLREIVANHEFTIGNDLTLKMTCSIGYASYPFMNQAPDAVTWEQIINIADNALYAAKKSGRNAWIGITSADTTTDSDIAIKALGNTKEMLEDQSIFAHSSLSGLINWDK
ncbi:MAG: diguanylate cyclase [Psychrosphaera sp.]|nr:diguanylate cyclase [Psychrosphaera sp.]